MADRSKSDRENAALDAVRTRQEADADATRKTADRSAASPQKNETAAPDSPKRQGDKMADAVDAAAGQSKNQA
ncbi:hypothetical protein [Microvirga massiliensis]|uniref:hypothetical protein n=1 Tax=Microvirga massiliensis TaxID=1033741 RepID=UPI00062BDCE1|nr:hypothetical protein [Microvirga massiliensis]